MRASSVYGAPSATAGRMISAKFCDHHMGRHRPGDLGITEIDRPVWKRNLDAVASRAFLNGD